MRFWGFLPFFLFEILLAFLDHMAAEFPVSKNKS